MREKVYPVNHLCFYELYAYSASSVTRLKIMEELGAVIILEDCGIRIRISTVYTITLQMRAIRYYQYYAHLHLCQNQQRTQKDLSELKKEDFDLVR